MITKEFALKLFEGFSIERWNDLIRPIPLLEMDKASEKTMLSYIIGKYEEKDGRSIDWKEIIFYSIFDLLKKIAMCDIKAPVQRMIRREYPEEYKKINEWVYSQYKDLITDTEIKEKFKDFLTTREEETKIEYRIFRAAHKYSTFREFEIIKHFNDRGRLMEIEKEIQTDISEYMDLKGVQLLMTRQQPYEFLMFIEQLRFQTRWNQTPRVPKTDVLGHSFFVAILTFLLGRNINMCGKRIYNNFFSALFHDLPEAVTRDIITPVKKATNNLPEVVKEIEDKIVEQELMPTIDDTFKREIEYFTNNEFENRIVEKDGKVCFVSYEELNNKYNKDQFSPVDGKIIRASDHIAAFMEADRSITHGITSIHLTEGRENLLKNYHKGETVNGLDIHSFLTSFLN